MTAVATQLQQPVRIESPPVIAVRGLSKAIDQRQVLRDVNFAVNSNEYIGVFGRNGAGKTTLLKILATLATASSGELRLFGQVVSRSPTELRRRIGLIDHQSLLYRDLTAAENLEFYAALYGLSRPATTARDMLERFGLAARANDAVKSLSRGMIQRLAIARALLHKPELLLADEPFAGLDAPSCQFLEQLFSQLIADGTTIILVNHDIEQALRLVDRVIVLRNGTIALDQPARRLYPAEILAEVAAT